MNKKFFKIINMIAFLLLFMISVFLIINRNNIFSDMEGYTNKNRTVEILTMYFLEFIAYVLLVIIERFPNAWNTGVTVNERNKHAVYNVLHSFIVILRAVIVLWFDFLIFHMSTGGNISLVFITIFFSTWIIMMIVFVKKLKKASRLS